LHGFTQVHFCNLLKSVIEFIALSALSRLNDSGNA